MPRPQRPHLEVHVEGHTAAGAENASRPGGIFSASWLSVSRPASTPGLCGVTSIHAPEPGSFSVSRWLGLL
jgi:hypothetical protein